MNRFFLLILLCFAFLPSNSKEINSKIEANEYIFASITISEGEYIWPISFDLLFIPGDTISINTKNVNMFISQLLEQGAYVSDMAFTCPQIFCDMFGNNSENYEFGMLFVSNFNHEFNICKQSISFPMLTGETAKLSFAKIKGFFIVDQNHKYIYTDSNSLDVTEYCIIRNVLPISIMDFEKSELDVEFNQGGEH